MVQVTKLLLVIILSSSKFSHHFAGRIRVDLPWRERSQKIFLLIEH